MNWIEILLTAVAIVNQCNELEEVLLYSKHFPTHNKPSLRILYCYWERSSGVKLTCKESKYYLSGSLSRCFVVGFDLFFIQNTGYSLKNTVI